MTCRFTQNASCFRVDEELFYAPSGTGDHVFARFEKIDLSTAQLKKAVSERSGVPLRMIHHAGTKDRAATARQWLSWPHQQQRQPLGDGPNFRLLETQRHPHGLSIGHVKANRFTLTFQGTPPAILIQGDAPSGTLPGGTLPGGTFPNFFGRQRFGHRGLDLRGLPELLANPRRTSMDVSRYQAALFNAFFQRRREEIGDRVISGDLCVEAFRKKAFVVTDDRVDAVDFMDLSPTGPVFGYRMQTPEHGMEREFLAGLGVELEDFRSMGKRARGGRRPLYVAARDIRVSQPGLDSFDLAFTLPSGAYATVFLTHLFWPERLGAPVESWPDFTQTVIVDG